MPSVDSIISKHMIRLFTLVYKSVPSIHPSIGRLSNCFKVVYTLDGSQGNQERPTTNHTPTNRRTVCLDLLKFCLVHCWLSIIFVMEVVEADILEQRQGRPLTPELLVHCLIAKCCVMCKPTRSRCLGLRLFFLCFLSDLFPSTMMLLWELDRT